MSEPTIEELLATSKARAAVFIDGDTGVKVARAILEKLERIQKNESIFWTRQELIDNLVGRIREALGDDQ